MEPISVVIPIYNRAKLLVRALLSVCAAISGCDEIIVVDDGSTDETAAIVTAATAPWKDRVRYLPIPQSGAGRARNAGVAACRNDLIAFADSDDKWLPYRLELQRPVMENEPKLVFCFSDFGQLLPDGNVVPHWLVHWSGDTRPWERILAPGRPYAERWPLPAGLPRSDGGVRMHEGSMYARELHANYVNVNTLLARRSVIGDALHFGEDLPTHEDWECFARIARTGDCAYLDVDTAIQCSHEGPRLTQASLLESAQARMKIIERTWAGDPEFMRSQGKDVAVVLADLRRTVLRQLIRLNRRDEAHEILARCDGAWLERLALILPHAVLRRLGRGV